MLKTRSLILCASLVLSVSCENNNGTGNGTILYWSANNQYEQDLAKIVVQEWNEMHPEIPVKHQPIPEGQSSEEVVLAAVVGKTTPDVYSNMWPGDVQLYVNANALVPVSDFADFDSILANRSQKDILDEARSEDGKTYQVPWKTNPIMVLYNKKFFNENGFEAPGRTYSEFLKQAKAITADLDGDGYTDRYMGIRDIRALWWQRFFDYYALYLGASKGGNLIENNKPVFDNQASVEVFDFLQTIFKGKYFPMEKSVARGDPFLSGRVATRFVGPWEITHAEKFKPEGFEFDFAPLPVPDGFEGPVYTYGDLKNIVLFKTHKDPQHAWEFVKFMISRKNDHRLLTMSSQLPVRMGILNDTLYHDYFEQNPMMVRFAQQAEHIRGIDTCKDMKEIFDTISLEYEACVVYGVKTPQQAIHDAAKRAELILK